LSITAGMFFWAPIGYLYNRLKEFLGKYGPVSVPKAWKLFFDVLVLAIVGIVNVRLCEMVVKYQPLAVLEDIFFENYKIYSEYFTAFPEDLALLLILLFMLVVWAHEML